MEMSKKCSNVCNNLYTNKRLLRLFVQFTVRCCEPNLKAIKFDKIDIMANLNQSLNIVNSY